MKLIPTDKRPCRLSRGEARRVPQQRRNRVIGYHVCCPRCGFVCTALQGDDGLVIAEGTDPEAITFSRPLRCTYCQVDLIVSAGTLTLEEGPGVRNVRFR
jgi:hypothetical protein